MAGSIRIGRAHWLTVVVIGLALATAGVLLKPASAEAKPFWGLTGELQAEDLAGMREAGVSSVATLLPWHALEPTGPGSLNWNGIDAFVGEAAEQDIEVIFILYGTPPHLTTQPEIAPVGGAAVEAGWREFVRSAVQRYGPRGEFWKTYVGPARPVRAWQVWNEPGLRFFFQPKPSVRDYIKLLKATSNAIRGVDPGAKVLMGGLNDPQGGPHISLTTFLKRFYEVGGSGITKKFDALALHPYGADNTPILRKLNLTRDAMKRGGDGKKPIWVTELGWSSEKGSNRLQVGAKQQKKRLRAGLALMKRNKREFRIRRVLAFTWQDAKPTSPCWCDTAGLLDSDGQAKPALAAFEAFAKG